MARSSRSGLLLAGLILVCALSMGCGAKPTLSDPIFFPPGPEPPRVQLLTSFNGEADFVDPPSAFESFILGEKKQALIGKPYGVALFDGHLFVCDGARPGGLWISDLANRTLTYVGFGQPGVRKANNIAIDKDGTRYVTDTKLNKVIVYDWSNKMIGSIGHADMWRPGGVALFEDRLYVSDVRGGQIFVIDKNTREELGRIGRLGKENGELYFPTNVAVDQEGNVYVTDTGHYTIQKFDPRGKFLQRIGRHGRSVGRFGRPKGLAVDREGRVLVVDAALNKVQIFAPDGGLLLAFGDTLVLPAGLSIDYDNLEHFEQYVAPGQEIEYLILVTSQYSPQHKVNVYGFLRQSPEQRKADEAALERRRKVMEEKKKAKRSGAATEEPPSAPEVTPEATPETREGPP